VFYRFLWKACSNIAGYGTWRVPLPRPLLTFCPSGFVSKHPFLAASLSAWTFFIISFATLGLCLAPTVMWRYDESQLEPPPVKTESRRLSQDLVDEKGRKKKSIKRSRSRGADVSTLTVNRIMLQLLTCFRRM
jgi:hypothetical protein